MSSVGNATRRLGPLVIVETYFANDLKKMGGAEKLSAPRLVKWCGGEVFAESASELRATGSERNRKDDRAS